MAFHLSEQLIHIDKLRNSFNNNLAAGAVVVFEGIVRNRNYGREVLLLEYEAYEKLAQEEAAKIIAECRDKFSIIDSEIVHRTGKLEVGECAVWIAVSAAHRDAAFKACRYLIDEIKARLPIWKKESYTDGSTEWVNCRDGHPLIKEGEEEYYARQISLTELTDGQKLLKQARVLVIGAGGLGCAALTYMASAGIGTIGICDFDQIDLSNLHRQCLYQVESVGLNKVDVAKNKLSSLNPFIKINTYNMILDSDNAKQLALNYDLLIDCTDNIKTKLLLNSVAVQVDKPIIQASIYQYDGQIHRLVPGVSGQCLQCLWGENALEASTCREIGTLGAVVGVVGAMQAMEAIKFLTGMYSPLDENIFLIDLITLQNHKIKVVRCENCSVCGGGKNDQPMQLNGQFEIKIVEQAQLGEYELIDSLQLAVKQLDKKFNTNHKYLLYCMHGTSSRAQALRLRRLGWNNVYSLKHGLNGNPVVKEILTAKI